MGRGFTQYSFPDSETEDAWALYSAFLDYELADGTLLHVRQAACWCAICDCILMAEDVPSVAALESELATLENPTEEDRQLIDFIGTPLSERITEQKRRIQWRRSRQSAARCLQCGSTEITVLPGEDEFHHPQTGERVAVSGRGFAETGMWEARFTPEGELIRHLTGRA